MRYILFKVHLLFEGLNRSDNRRRLREAAETLFFFIGRTTKRGWGWEEVKTGPLRKKNFFAARKKIAASLTNFNFVSG